MRNSKLSKLLVASFIVLGLFMSATNLVANETVDVIIQVDKPYTDLIKFIEDNGGEVTFEYKYIDAISASIPLANIDEIGGHSAIKHMTKDRSFKLDEGKVRERDGFGVLPSSVEASATSVESLDINGLKAIGDAINGHLPDVELTGASAFWDETGHFGEGVIIGIMDTGTSDVAAISGRVLGGANFTGDGIGANDPSNISHGTNVATAAGANAIFIFPDTHPWAIAFATHLPGMVYPEFGGPGTIGIPMIGPAPFADFFALKIFNAITGSTSNSIILAAFDYAIDVRTKYNNGEAGGINLGVINGSFGGLTLNAGDDPFFGAMVSQLHAAGIVTAFSAGNDGPSGMTVGDPGAGKNNLTVGATTIPEYERIYADIAFGAGIGELWRANDLHQVVEFSSRGPNADGRCDPEIVAPGDWIFMQNPTGSVSIGGGTSFSSPMVAGAAACLLSAHPGATQDQVRAALLAGANPNLLAGAGMADQGYGFLDLLGAEQNWGAANPPDVGLGSPDVADNIKYACGEHIKFASSNQYYRQTEWLLPGQRAEFYIPVNYKARGYSIMVNTTPENDLADQNQLFGDDLVVSIVGARTSDAVQHYYSFVPTSANFTLSEDMLNFGIVRVTLMGDWTNVGRVKAEIFIEETNENPGVQPVLSETVAEGFSDFYLVDIPAEKTDIDLALVWEGDWGAYPTNDLDLYIYNLTDGGTLFATGATLDAPERLNIASLPAGSYLIEVYGFTVWEEDEDYTLYADLEALAKVDSKEGRELAENLLPEEFGIDQNYPNPFNPETTIQYHLPEAAQVKIEIFDIRGARVKTLVDGEVAAGSHAVNWNGINETGTRVSSGLYFYSMTTDNKQLRKSMLLLK